MIALEQLRPALRGIIKVLVDELLDNPNRRLGSCQAHVGDFAPQDVSDAQGAGARA
jgi:hypothetical protein